MRNDDYYFPHETLDCYTLARDVARWIAARQVARGDSDLRDQAVRAARSMVLNIAEGCGRSGKSRRYHYSVAAGSASELGAVLDLVDFDGDDAQQDKLRRVALMLRAMTRT